MKVLIIWLLITFTVNSQSQATLTQPPSIQTNTITLRKTSSNITLPQTGITFMQSYSNTPLVFLSLVTMQTFSIGSLVTFTQKVQQITRTYFNMTYDLTCMISGVVCDITKIEINYLVFDYATYPFIQPINENFILDPLSILLDQYYEIRYTDNLDNHNTYSLNCLLSGFQSLLVIGEPFLKLDVVYNDKRTYFFNIEFRNLALISVDFIRILIDQTDMKSRYSSPSSLNCLTGTIYHSSDVNVVENNPTPDFLPFAMLYGIKGFSGVKVSLTSFVYLFNNTIPRIQVNIGYLLFVTLSCPTNQLYVSAINRCYGLSSAFFYQATPATMLPCPYSCYQCVGPLTTQCKSCMQGYNRIISSGRCLCRSGFYDPGGPICKNCTEAISGCKTCSSATNCLTCLTGCTAIGFSSLYCDCPTFIQPNSSYNCPKTFYFDYSLNNCTCLPQTYLNTATGLCFSCAAGCYICIKSANYCTACIDSYTLINNTCLYFYLSYSLLGQASNYNDPKLRCLRWDRNTGGCLYKCKYYFYQFNCYTKCPAGTFNISRPWLTCQPCQNSCQYCFNYTICYQCATNYYYFNSSILSCSKCRPNCLTCTSYATCSKCENYYVFSGDDCVLPAIPEINCSLTCQFCLLEDQCLKCSAPYFLNQSSGLCIECSQLQGLQLWSTGCQQICGDGKKINQQCDDGNTKSGDGCSSYCTIQPGFACSLIHDKSYCWSRDIDLVWEIYFTFGQNVIIVKSWSPTVDIEDIYVSLSCGFKYQIISQTLKDGIFYIKVQYYQSLYLALQDKLALYTSQNSTSNNQCNVMVNNQTNFQITINSNPQIMYVDYSNFIEQIINGDTVKNMGTFAAYLGFATTMLATSPVTSFACIRIYLAVLFTYTDYQSMPINSFGPYESLQRLLMIEPATDSSHLSSFDSSYYLKILYPISAIYVVTFLFLELVMRFIAHVSKSMDWNLLHKIAYLAHSQRAVSFQTLTVSYEIITLTFAAKTFANIGQATIQLLVVTSIHLAIFIISKIHGYFTFPEFVKNNAYMAHTMIVQQFLNFSLAIICTASTEKNSYTPLMIILFSIYPLLSLNRNIPVQQKSDYNISIAMTVWHMRVSYLILISIQLLKLGNIWRGIIPMSNQNYENLAILFGRGIGVLMALLFPLSSISSTLIHIIKFCEIKNSGKQTIPTAQEIEVRTVDVNSNIE